MSGTPNHLGQITISPQAIATLAAQAALSTYGVVGLSFRNMVDGLTNILTRDPRHGIDIHLRPDGQLNIELYIIVEYGTRIATVASIVSDNVRFKVEKALGLSLGHIDVYVNGLRISNTDA